MNDLQDLQNWEDFLDMVDPCTCDQKKFNELKELAPSPEAGAYLAGIEEARKRAFSNSLAPLDHFLPMQG